MEGFKSTLACLVITAIVVGLRSQHTTTNVCSNRDEISCDDGRCIKNELWCDGELECVDRSDEKYCKTKGLAFWSTVNTCSKIHFECRNGRCVPAAAQCNTYDNCGDYSDEEYCEASPSEPSSITTESNFSYDPYNFYDSYTSPRSAIRSPTKNPGNLGSTTSFYDKKYFENFDSSNVQKPPPVYHTLRATDRYNTPTTTYSSRYPITYPPAKPRGTTQEPNIVHRLVGYTLIPPWVILNLPPLRPSYDDRQRSKNLNLPAFNFTKNYTTDYEYDYRQILYDAKEWLMNQRDGSYNWGRDTPRALIALSLITNSFSSNVSDNHLMKKSLQAHLGIKVLRSETGIEKMSSTRLAMYINAVLATCQNPSDFLGQDLVDMLLRKSGRLEQHQRFVNPLVFLTMCLANKPADSGEMQYLVALMTSRFDREVSKDIHILAMTALSCFSQRQESNRNLRSKLQEAFRDLLNQRNKDDGSFGSVYTTALAVQALMSIDTDIRWDPKPSLDYIASHQNRDGSFGNMLLTYYSIIALSGRSLVHLRNTQCDPATEEKKEVSDCPAEEIMNQPGPRKTIIYTLRIGHPETFSVSQQLTVPETTKFMDIMCVAKQMDPRYKFKHKVTNGLAGVYSIAGVPNDPERGLFWSVYILQPGKKDVDIVLDRYKEDLNILIPHDGDEVLFWYLPSS